MKHTNGILTISLDFELHWGCLESKKILNDQAKRYFLNTRKAIPQMLELFKKGEIHVTWAAVGMLFCKTASEWKQVIPDQIPGYQDPEVSVYQWVANNGFEGEKDPYHFAPELIDCIRQTPFQEIGTHTFSHYFCCEQGQTAEDFKVDMLAAKRMAEEKGITLRSLVFPRNQYADAYLRVCQELGITAVRTNPDVWYWTPVAKSGILRKLFRTADAYVSFAAPKQVKLDSIQTTSLPLQLPASRLYRPWQPRYPVLNKWKLNRIRQEMTSAAQNKACYHLWWHPHNFGNHPDECLKELEAMIEHYHHLQRQFGFQSMNMGELTQMLMHQK